MSLYNRAVLPSFTLLLLLSFPFSISATPNPDPNPISPRAALPTLLARQDILGETSCEPFYSIIGPCSSATPGILTLPFSLAAQCYCYSSSSWRPAAYDSALAICTNYLSSADPAFFTALPKNGLQVAPCKALGNIAAMSSLGDTSTSGPVSLTGSATTTGSQDANRKPCSPFLNILSSCEAHDPVDFTTAVGGHSIFSQEASCLCYTTKSSSDVFAPSIFDGYWASCVDWYQTASPAFYSASILSDAVSVVRAPCSSIGDVRNAGAASSSSAVAATGAVTRPGAGPSTTTASATPTSTALTGVTTTVAASSVKTGAAHSVNVNCMMGFVLGLLVLTLYKR